MAQLSSLTVNGDQFNLPRGTTVQRPADPVAGMTRFNTSTSSFESYDGVKWITIGSDRLYPGATSWNYASSGYELATRYAWLPSGYYWIKNGNMPIPLQMYVDMTEEGGGYDFFPINNGVSVARAYQVTADVNQSAGGWHSGIPLGLDRMYPRSKQHWIALSNFVQNILLQNVDTYHTTHMGPIYRETTGGDGSASGDYNLLGVSMRNPRYYSDGVPDWKVPDNGRWWLRDTVFTEPNGDYGAYGHLRMRAAFPQPYTGQDLAFNDLSSYVGFTGANYIVSTNTKP